MPFSRIVAAWLARQENQGIPGLQDEIDQMVESIRFE